jgi:hypothetical protein
LVVTRAKVGADGAIAQKISKKLKGPITDTFLPILESQETPVEAFIKVFSKNL